jgi:Cyclic-phosphate processing Receiver domain
VFLTDNPHAIWVTTVAECLARLDEEWEEVHLDHDLGGKTFVDIDDEDCGMEVIRWLCREPRNHLTDTLFFVHTHNATAGLLMVLQMRGRGYKAEFRPFGLDLARVLAHNEPATRPEALTESTPRGAASRWMGWIRTYWPFSGERRPENAQKRK